MITTRLAKHPEIIGKMDILFALRQLRSYLAIVILCGKIYS